MRLPSAARLRAREVCREWRETLSDPRLWRAADVSTSEAAGAGPWLPACYDRGFMFERYALRAPALFAAGTLARGALSELDVSGCVPRLLGFRCLLRFAQQHAASLRALRVCDCAEEEVREWWQLPREPPAGFSEASVARLLTAAPELERLDVDVRCTALGAVRLAAVSLQNPALRVRHLSVVPGSYGHPEYTILPGGDAAGAFLAALRVIGSGALRQLCVADVRLPPALAVALCEAALQKQLTTLCLCGGVTAAALPALTRLLREGRLKELALRGGSSGPLWPDASETGRTPWERVAVSRGWREFCGGIRASTTLRALTLVKLTQNEPWALRPLTAAVMAHPTLREITFSSTRAMEDCSRWHHNAFPDDAADDTSDDADADALVDGACGYAPRWVRDARAHGRALARIIGANAPALRSLCYEGVLCEPGIEALLPSLGANTHLRQLGVWCVPPIRPADDDDTPPPAVRARFVTEVMRPALLRAAAAGALRCVRFVRAGEALPDAEDARHAAEGVDTRSEEPPERDAATQMLRHALAALAADVAARHEDRRAARDWAHVTRHWTRSTTVQAAAQRER
jgi:hypothetical protein